MNRIKLNFIATSLIIISAMVTFAHASEETDKAEFKKLYAEFNELYANSQAIDPIIEVGENLYKIAPKAYGKSHMNTAVVTYNLASLYDEKGGNKGSKEEKKANKLYKEYFRILDKLKTPIDRNYIDQYKKYVITDHNISGLSVRISFALKFLDLVKRSNLSKGEIADIEYEIALLKVSSTGQENVMPILESALKNYKEAYGSDYLKVGMTLYWLAKLEEAKQRPFNRDPKKLQAQYKKPLISAEVKYLEALRIFELHGEEAQESIKTTKSTLAQFYYNQYQPEKGVKYHNTAISPEEINRAKNIKLIEETPPKYPYFAKRNRLKGVVKLEYTVDENGNTKDIFVTSSPHINFNRAAINAVSNYKFEPVLVNNKPIEVIGVKSEITFE